LLSSVLVFVAIRWLAMSVRGFAFVNIAIVLLWILMAAQLARENRRLTAQAEPAAA
jgi:hypothetical protein